LPDWSEKAEAGVCRRFRNMDFTFGTVVYCFLVLAFFFGVWIYYDRRDHALFEAERRKLTFHCIRCGQLYTAKARRGTAACPHCGHTNTRLRF
jgi:Zn finger protein HypA/HybF involved in hydrogenase expression